MLKGISRENIESSLLVLTGSIYGLMLFVSSICSATSYPTSTATPVASDLSMNQYNLTEVGDIITKGPWVDVRAYASFSDAIDAIGISNKTLLIPNSQSVTANKTVPKNVTLQFFQGGDLNISVSVTVTINGSVSAPLTKIFTGSGTVILSAGAGAVVEVYPQWWGATGDGTTDDSTAIQSAIQSIPAAATQAEKGKGGIIYFPAGIYLCNTGLTNAGRKVSFIGNSIHDTTIKKGANDIDLLKVDSFMQFQSIKDISFDGNSKTGLSLLYLNTPTYLNIENVDIRNSASAISALYLEQASVATLRNISVNNNAKSAYFNGVNACNIYNLNIGGKTGASSDDTEFVSASETSIFGLSLSDDGGIQISNCVNFNINGFYIETTLAVPAITIGKTGLPVRGISIQGVNATVITGTHNGPLIKAQLSSVGISLRDMLITQTQVTPYALGWIELAEVFGVTIDNIVVQNMSPTVSGANLIFSSSVGPDNVTINNVQAYDDQSTTTISLKADNLIIQNSNVPITIQSNSTKATLINCTGTITDASNISTRIGNYYASSYRSIASAAQLTLGDGNTFFVTGTTNVTSIDTASSIRGRKITLVFAGALSFGDGNNLKLAGNFATTADDTITLVCDGTNWYEVSRRAN